MTRAHHVQKAAKDYPEHGIKKGEPYYWWKFRHGGKHFSKSCPRQSQLTQSEFRSSVYSLQEREQPGDQTGLESEVQDIISELEQLRDDAQDKLDNMPESLQQGPTGELLQNRIDSVDGAISELESIDTCFEHDESDEDNTEDEQLTNWLDEKWEEVTSALDGISD